MPYRCEKENGKDTKSKRTNYTKVKADTGKVVSHHKTKKKCEGSIRAYYSKKEDKDVDVVSSIAEMITDDPDIFNETKLTAKKRKKLKGSSFAIPKKRKYPIHDKSHARNALSRVSQHGSPEEKKKVRAAVKRKYPSIKQG